MADWIVFTLAATLFQTLRFMAQKQAARAGLSASGATFARFLWSAPLIWAAFGLSGIDWPALGPGFWRDAAIGGITQILATVCVVALLQSGNFATGIALKKTEVLLTVVAGFVLLGETVTPLALAAMTAGFAGVLMLTRAEGGYRLDRRVALLGLGSGVFFAISGVSYRAATLQVPGGAPERAMIGLCAVVTLQLAGQGLWLVLFDRTEIGRVVRAWRTTSLVGLTSVAGSYCWFAAFSLQTAALVYAVGQAEVVLSLLASVLIFRERLRPLELAGIALISSSVLTLILRGS